MDFMKVFDQTVREIKREVNLKVLKVPEIEQKVLDATDDEPWGPHGSALAEIAQATKKFTECQMVMNVLWGRLGEMGKNWRLVYKALSVIEYLVAHGSDRAVDDIIEHTFQISSLTSFEYVEPSGKDAGLNVRKKAENIVVLLNDKEKIQEARNKAAANHDKYFGLSSTGITYKSSSASHGSSSFQSFDRYGGISGTRDSDSFRDSYKDKERYEQDKIEKDAYRKSCQGRTSEGQGSTLKQSSAHFERQKQSDVKTSPNNSVTFQRSSVPSNSADEFDDDDFDPRGTSTNFSAETSNQVDLFGQSLIGDLMDAPPRASTEMLSTDGKSSEVDLFADATFVSAPSQAEMGVNSKPQTQVDLFASQPVIPSADTSTVDFFTSPVPQLGTKISYRDPTNTNIADPFAAVPVNNFDGSDLFGAFTSSSNSASTEATQTSTGGGNLKSLAGQSSLDSMPRPKKESFQVKSGIWADSLSRGLIDLNISASKKVSLVDVGVVGDLIDGQSEKDKGPPTSLYRGKAMGQGSGLGRTGFMSSQSEETDVDDFFSNLGGQEYQFGSFQK